MQLSYCGILNIAVCWESDELGVPSRLVGDGVIQRTQITSLSVNPPPVYSVFNDDDNDLTINLEYITLECIDA